MWIVTSKRWPRAAVAVGAAAVRNHVREKMGAAPATTGVHRQGGQEETFEATTAEEAWKRLAAGLRAQEEEGSVSGQRRATAVETNATEEKSEDDQNVSCQEAFRATVA